MFRGQFFSPLAEKEPQLGYVVMRNIERTPSMRLRTTNFKLRNNHDWCRARKAWIEVSVTKRVASRRRQVV
jgi:hypothetical protein